MDLLTPTPAPVQDAATLARIQAQNNKSDSAALLAYPAAELASRLADSERNFARVWGNPNPANILLLLGTSAAQLFQLAALELAALEAIKPGCTAAIQATIKPTVAHPDGTVTLEAS